MGGIPAMTRKTRIGKEGAIRNRYKDEITKELAVVNVKREMALAFALIIIVAMILVISYMNWDTRQESLYVALAAYRLHIILLMSSVLFLSVMFGIMGKSEENIHILKAAHIFMVNFVMIFCSIIAVYNEMEGQRPFSYMTAMLCIGSVILMPSIERTAVYVFSWCIYQIGMLIWVRDPIIIFQNFIFVTLLTLLSLLISKINYSSYTNNFINRKIIEENSRELDRLYKITEESLLKRTEELNQAKELEKVRTAFFTNISHELRTPLNIIFSTEQILEHKFKDTQQQSDRKEIDQYMRIMKHNCYRLIRLIDNLIDMTKIDAGYLSFNPISCDIVKIVEDITLSVADYIGEKNIYLTFDTDIEERVIYCDPEKIERIVLNLLSNAKKFTPTGGQVFVNVHEEKDKVVFCVKDTGIGIPEPMLGRIFDRFVQVDKTSTRAREGSGIGLSLVRSLIEMHGGSISVISELGKGSEFIVEIPAKESSYENIHEEGRFMNRYNKIESISIEFSDIYD